MPQLDPHTYDEEHEVNEWEESLGSYGYQRREGVFTGLGKALLAVALGLIVLLDVLLVLLGQGGFALVSTLVCLGMYWAWKWD